GLSLASSASVADSAGNAIASLPLTASAFTIDKMTPTATITRNAGPQTNASSVTWTVSFSEPVLGLSAANFTLTFPPTISGPAISSVGGSGSVYTITVSTGIGDGALGLSLSNSTGLTDAAGNAVSTPVAGAAYAADRTAPTITFFSPTPDQVTTPVPVTLTL